MPDGYSTNIYTQTTSSTEELLGTRIVVFEALLELDRQRVFRINKRTSGT